MRHPTASAIKVLDHVVAQDVGHALNPALVEGQMRGGTTQVTSADAVGRVLGPPDAHCHMDRGSERDAQRVNRARLAISCGFFVFGLGFVAAFVAYALRWASRTVLVRTGVVAAVGAAAVPLVTVAPQVRGVADCLSAAHRVRR